jgi:hypothetical protein
MIVDDFSDRVNGMPTKINLGGIPAYMDMFMKFVVKSKTENCKDKRRYGLQTESKLKGVKK